MNLLRNGTDLLKSKIIRLDSVISRPFNKINIIIVLSFLLLSCAEKELDFNFKIYDENLRIELVAENSIIMTPIRMTIDKYDAIYVMESHTHSLPSNYKGLKFDRIFKCEDLSKMSDKQSWQWKNLETISNRK